MTVLVTGAGGFIGGHLVKQLINEGKDVKAVDIKPLDEWFQVHDIPSLGLHDLTQRDVAYLVADGVDDIYNLAADMGGMGFIENHKTDCMLSVLANTHLLVAAQNYDVKRFFFASSACVYPDYRQTDAEVAPLAEADAYPAMPEDGYGWEKLFSERMCHHFREDYGIETRVARYHNVYGPYGTWEGGREKAPAALCRKVIAAKLSGDHEIEVWGDGEQTRSFMFIDDAIKGTRLLMESSFASPMNIGSNRLVTINELIDIIQGIAGIEVKRNYDTSAPLGVRGRNSDNTLIQQILGWEPTFPLEAGLEITYRYIYDQMV